MDEVTPVPVKHILYGVPSDGPFESGGGFWCFGAYRVEFLDGLTVMMPHTGMPDTVGAEPLDPEFEPHRRVLEAEAREIRKAHEHKLS